MDANNLVNFQGGEDGGIAVTACISLTKENSSSALVAKGGWLAVLG